MAHGVEWVCVDGVLRKADDVTIRADDHGFRYGMMACEVMRVWDGVVPLAPHDVRMRIQCATLHIAYAPPMARICARMRDVCSRAADHDMAVHWIVSAGVPQHHTYASPIELIALARVYVRTHVRLRILPIRIPTCARESSMRVWRAQGKRMMYDGDEEGLLLRHDDTVGETTSGEVLWYADGRWTMPHACAGRAPSVTRSHVWRIAQQWGVAMQSCAVDVDTLCAAEEVCVVNAVEGVVPVRTITDATGRTMHCRMGAHTIKMRQALFDMWTHDSVRCREGDRDDGD